MTDKKEHGHDPDFEIPDSIREVIDSTRILGREEISIIKQWTHTLPNVDLIDPDTDKEDCCCCCCCCCHDRKDDCKDPDQGGGGKTVPPTPPTPPSFNPSLMLHVNPSGLHRNIERIEGSFSWTSSAGTQWVAIEWARYNNQGILTHDFEPISPDHARLPATGFALWNTGPGSWGHRVHIRVITDSGVASKIRWRDGNGGAGWL